MQGSLLPGSSATLRTCAALESLTRAGISGAPARSGPRLLPSLSACGAAGHATGSRASLPANDADQLGSRQPSGAGIRFRFDAVIHLAGESIVGRWTGAKKKQRFATAGCTARATWPRHLPRREEAARADQLRSAIGYYGNRGDEVLKRGKRPGTGFSRGSVPASGRRHPARGAGGHSNRAESAPGSFSARSGGALAEDAAAVSDGRGRQHGLWTASG